MRSPAAKTTVIIPNWNGMSWLGPCLQSLQQQDTTDFHTMIVDNGSMDGSVAFVQANYPEIEIVQLARNTGFAAAANVGIARATTPYIALLNTDTRVYADWLSSLTHKMETSPPEIAAIAPQLLRLDRPDRIDDAGDELSWYGAAMKRGHNQPAANYEEECEIFSPCAAACLYPRDFLLKAGGFDEDMFAYLEDMDLGLRGRLLGYRYIYFPKAKALHKGHGAGLPSARYVELITRNRLLLFAKNIPTRLLLRHAARLLYGQLYFFIVHAHPWASLKGYAAFVVALRGTLRKRRRIARERLLDVNDIDRLLHERPPAPSLATLAMKVMSGACANSTRSSPRKRGPSSSGFPLPRE